MTDDFMLFPDAADAASAIDPDIALITAYLGRELTLIQIVAVEDRLVADDAFQEKVRPIIGTWAAPRSWGIPTTSPHASGTARSSSLRDAEIESGWQGYLRRMEGAEARGLSPARPQPATRRADAPTTRAFDFRRMGSTRVRRIAALVAVATLPALAIAQVIAYVRHRPSPIVPFGTAGDLPRAVTLSSPAIRAAGDSASDSDASRTARARTPTRVDHAGDSTHQGGTMKPLSLLMSVPVLAGAQSPLPAHLPGPVVASMSTALSDAYQAVTLRGGQLLLADGQRHTVRMFDSALTHPIVVLDSAPGLPNSYPTPIPGSRAGTVAAAANRLSAFRGDSALWFDGTVRRFVVITPTGQLGRLLPPPAPPGPAVRRVGNKAVVAEVSEFDMLGPPAWSESLGLVFMERFSAVPAGPSAGLNPNGAWVSDDSMSIVRKDYDTGTQDTLASLAFSTRVHPPQGLPSYASTFFNFSDQVAVTSDGTVCVFRARDFRLEWIGPNGARLPSVPVDGPHRPAPTGDRRYDSVMAVRVREFDSVMAPRWAAGARSPDDRPPTPSRPVLLAEVADGFAPTPGPGSMIADQDNRVWLHVVPSVLDIGFEHWEAISRTEGIVDHLRVPSAQTVIGFQPGGYVVLLSRGGSATVTVEKARLRP